MYVCGELTECVVIVFEGPASRSCTEIAPRGARHYQRESHGCCHDLCMQECCLLLGGGVGCVVVVVGATVLVLGEGGSVVAGGAAVVVVVVVGGCEVGV